MLTDITFKEVEARMGIDKIIKGLDIMASLTKYQKEPCLTSDGRPWVQGCYVCAKTVDFVKHPRVSWLRVGTLVRHKKCYPGMPR